MTARIAYWDNFKFVLIYLVVLGHYLLPVSHNGNSVQAAYYLIYLFHMPAFVFVSGYFSKSYVGKNNKEYKLLGFISLYIMFSLTLCFIQLLLSHKAHLSEILKNPSAPWYLLSMFFWYLIIPFIASIRVPISVVAVALLALIIGKYPECNHFLALSRTIVLFPFFLIGYYFNGKIIAKIKPWMRCLAAFIFAVSYVTLFFYYNSFAKYLGIVYAAGPYKDLGFSTKIGMLVRMSWFVIAFILTASLVCLIPQKHLPTTYIGQRTLGIYIFHRLLRDILKHFGIYKYMGHGASLLGSVIVLSGVITFIFSSKYISSFVNFFFHLDGFMKKNQAP